MMGPYNETAVELLAAHEPDVPPATGWRADPLGVSR